MEDLQIDIARYLSVQAMDGVRTTYPALARAVNWAHPQGRGLGRHLGEVLRFTYDRGLPCLTSILCVAGTKAPPDGAVTFIKQIYGSIDIAEEQRRVFAFDWTSIADFSFEPADTPEINFDRIFATRTWGFDPANWGMTGFSYQPTRDRILQEMGDQPIYVIYFCSQHSEAIEGHEGRFTIAPQDVARVLGVLEVQPRKATHQTHTHPDAVKDMINLWGKTRWDYGLENTRAWRFVTPPWTREALPHARSLSWEATRGIVPLTDEEKRLVGQYALQEVSLFGSSFIQVAYSLREPMHTTYLAVCEDQAVLAKANAPAGMTLVKIGVSGNTDRRLRDLNDHHFAKIFGLRFRMMTTKRWPSQDQALAQESQALEWGLENTTHASGEYFFMTEKQIMDAVLQVRSTKAVR